MTERFQIYKCKICGNVVQVLFEGQGGLVCCGEDMELLSVQHETNELGEKHAPELEYRGKQKFVDVIRHPMTKEHYIQFIQGIDRDKKELHLKYFHPEEIPEFDVSYTSDNTDFIELCNIHGLWGNKNG